MQRVPCLIWMSAAVVLTAMTGCHQERTIAAAAGDAGSGTVRGELTITGSSTMAPLVAEIARRFMARHPAVRIDVQSGGSGKGIQDVRSGIADIGMSSRALQAVESDLEVFPVAVDGVALIVHRSNPVSELTPEQVVAIFTGKIRNWSAIGGPDQPISVVHKAEGRATLEVFLTHFQLRNPDVRPDVIVGDNEHAVRTVAGAPGAIGYVSIGTATADVQSGVPIRLLPLDGIPADCEAVAAGRFPMSRPLILVVRHDRRPLTDVFLRFCRSEQVDDIITAQYFVPAAR